MSELSRLDFCDRVKRNVAYNFDQSAEAYQAFEDQFHFFAGLTVRLADFIDLQPGSDVLDVGCGSGVSARTLHEAYGCRVLGVDLSPRMVQIGRALCDNGPIELVVGDGERLMELVGGRRFDYVMYNASIFVFPDVDRTIREAAACLRAGGKIAYSFYPRLSDEADNDLLEMAFRRTGQPPPRHRVITTYERASEALEAYCGPVIHDRWVQQWDLALMKAFYSIPAQSASLFPGCPYDERRARAAALLEKLDDGKTQIIVTWRMAQATKR